MRRWLVGHTNIGVAWLFALVYSVALVFASTWMVVEWAPQAAGAGVAEVMAYLNGCMLPHVRLFRPSLRPFFGLHVLFPPTFPQLHSLHPAFLFASQPRCDATLRSPRLSTI